MISPNTPGSGYVLLHHVMGELEGIRGAWGYPEGGMGAVSAAIAKSALSVGAQLFTDSSVKEVQIFEINIHIIIKLLKQITTNVSGEADGVILESGHAIKAKLVLSNATPEVTFNKLVKV